MYLTDIVRALPIKYTQGTDNYKILLNKKFDFNLISGDDGLFKGTTFDSNKNILIIENFVIEIKNNLLYFPNNYVIPIPKTIEDYVNIMYIFNISIFWSNKIISELEPIDYLPQNKIPEYYKELLVLMDKEHEIFF